jgi:hypothetical protein
LLVALSALLVNAATVANTRTAGSARRCHNRRALRSSPLSWILERALRRLIEFIIPRLPREE